jgi:pimeloyl-ACP methyl ester carboxylesterase
MSDTAAQKEFSNNGVALKFQTSQIEGTGIHYAITGQPDKPTLFFIHGSPGSWTAFKKYLIDTELLGHYRLISIDRPGYGQSNFGKVMNMTDQARIIGLLMRQLQNGQKFYVIGHSLGGPLAVKLAAENRDIVSGAILIAAAVDPNEEAPERWRHLLASFPFYFLLPRILRTSNAETMDFKKDVLTIPADLQHITCPVLIVQGFQDSIVPPGNAFYAQKQLVHSSKVVLVTFKDANHFIPWTRFEEIKKNIIAFAG